MSNVPAIAMWEEPLPGRGGAGGGTRAYLAQSSAGAPWGVTTLSSEWAGSIVASSSGPWGIEDGQDSGFIATLINNTFAVSAVGTT